MCEDIEPVDLETTLLSQMDYAINFQNSEAPRFFTHSPHSPAS